MTYSRKYAPTEVEAVPELLNDRNEQFVAKPGDFRRPNEDKAVTRSGVTGEG